MDTPPRREKTRAIYEVIGPLALPQATETGGFLARIFSPNSSMAEFFNALFFAAIAIGAMLAVLRLGQAGFYYMMSDVVMNKTKAKDILRDAVLGLMLLLSAWLIFNQINPQILDLNILQSIESSGGPQSGAAAPAATNSPFNQWCTNTTYGGLGGWVCFSSEAACREQNQWLGTCLLGRP